MGSLAVVITSFEDFRGLAIVKTLILHIVIQGQRFVKRKMKKIEFLITIPKTNKIYYNLVSGAV